MQAPEQWIVDARRRVGDHIRVRRIYKGMTQERVMEATGIARNTYKRIEAGETDTKLSHLLLIAQALDMLPADLLR